MAALSAEHKQQLREILEQRATLDTALQRALFLEDAGLRWLQPQVDMDEDARLFCYQVVSLCEQVAVPPEVGEAALVLLLRYVKENVVSGHEAQVALIDAMLAAPPAPTMSVDPLLAAPPPDPGTAPALWQEFQDADALHDWEMVISLGERLRETGYQVRETRPRLAAAYHMRAQRHQVQGEYEKALADSGRAILLDVMTAAYWERRGTTYHEAARKGHPAGDFAQSIGDKTFAISRDPDNAAFYVSRGITYDVAARAHHPIGSFDKAIADLTYAIALIPDRAAYYHVRGNTHTAMGQEQAAQADYEQARGMGYKG